MNRRPTMKISDNTETLFKVFFGVMIILFSLIIIWGLVSPNVSVGVNGFVETRCIDGYKFVVSNYNQVRQIMDEFAHGMKCDK